MKQAERIGAGIGPSGAGEGDNLSVAKVPHTHSHGICSAVSSPLMKVLGLDRFTKGKAVSGMRRAGKDQNPFDLGLVKVGSGKISADVRTATTFG